MQRSPTLVLASLAFAAAGCATAPSTPEVSSLVALENAGFEQPAEADRNCAVRWGCSMHADPKSFRFTVDAEVASEGRQSLRIEPEGKEPWAVATQVVRDTRYRGARLRLSLDMRLEGVAGNGAGLFFQVEDGAGRRLLADQKLVRGTQEWSRHAVEFDVSPQMYQFEVGAILDGVGRVWIDNVRLEVVQPGPGAKKPV